MEIEVNGPAFKPDDLIEQHVTYREQLPSGEWQEVRVMAWVPYNDDRRVTLASAKTAARSLLQRAIEAHDA